jgi:dihydroneopterin aldolase
MVLGRSPRVYKGDHIFVRGIEVIACHGVFDEERIRSQRFVVDVDCWTNAEEFARRDDYTNAICYDGVFQTVIDVLSGSPVSLIERLSIAIADALLMRFVTMRTVKVTVHKPDAPLSGRFVDVGVSLTRERIPHVSDSIGE